MASITALFPGLDTTLFHLQSLNTAINCHKAESFFFFSPIFPSFVPYFVPKWRTIYTKIGSKVERICFSKSQQKNSKFSTFPEFCSTSSIQLFQAKTCGMNGDDGGDGDDDDDDDHLC